MGEKMFFQDNNISMKLYAITNLQNLLLLVGFSIRASQPTPLIWASTNVYISNIEC
jgi:hypothetical protein